MASLGSSFSAAQTGLFLLLLVGDIWSMSCVSPEQPLGRYSRETLESFQLLEGSPTSGALALPPARPQPPWEPQRLL